MSIMIGLLIRQGKAIVQLINIQEQLTAYRRKRLFHVEEIDLNV